MSDTTTLREWLRRVDSTAPSIQGAAAAMMKHYDRSPQVAVTEWRNALHSADPEQLLPLLYVANEGACVIRELPLSLENHSIQR
jgi:hypothetical protein